MTEAMPFLQNYDITFLRPPPISAGTFCFGEKLNLRLSADFLCCLFLLENTFINYRPPDESERDCGENIKYGMLLYEHS